jgi:hypothetical protein
MARYRLISALGVIICTLSLGECAASWRLIGTRSGIVTAARTMRPCGYESARWLSVSAAIAVRGFMSGCDGKAGR